MQDAHGLTAAHYVGLKATRNQTNNYYLIFDRILHNLANFGAKFDIKAKDGTTALDLVKKVGDPNMLEIFMRVI